MSEAWKAWGLHAQAALQSKSNHRDYVELVESAETLQDCERASRHVFENFQLKCQTFWCNSLIKMYVRCGGVEEARLVFSAMNVRDLFSWNLMLTTYAKNGHREEARNLYNEMPEWNIVSLNVMLSCMSMETPASAKFFFDSMPAQDLFSWNALLTAYARFGHIEPVNKLFERMPERDLATSNILMSSSIIQGSIGKTKQIFESLPATNIVAWNSMLLAYARYGHLYEAENFYKQMPCWDIVSLGTLLSCFLRFGEAEKAKLLFDSMEFHDMVSLNASLLVYTSTLNDAKAFFTGMQDHDQVSWSTMLSIYIQNGQFEAAVKFFDRIPDRDVVSVTSILTALAQTGSSAASSEIFTSMLAEGMSPDQTCFTCLLLVCMHSGKWELGWRYFRSQLSDFDELMTLEPPPKQQYACMIDMLSRAGYLHHAKELLESMPYVADGHEWTSLLSSYRNEKDSLKAHLPSWLFRESSTYILLSDRNIQSGTLVEVPQS